MKPSLFKSCLGLAALLAGGPAVFAQSNGVPGPEDYAAFSHFITDRNIFDPARQPHYTTTSSHHHTTHTHTHTHASGSPGIQLVGTMSYEKGPFAFFNASSSEYRKVLHSGDQLAGYTVTEITADGVRLESADKKEHYKLAIGDGLLPDNGKWVYTMAKDMSTPISSASAGSSSGSDSSSASSSASATAATPPSASEPNDVLKRLMEQREKQNQ